MRGSRLAFAWLERWAPGLGSWWAERVFFTPPRPQGSDRLLQRLAGGRSFALPFGGGRLAAWTWGTGPAVLLVHGWGGRAAHLAAFIRPLTAAGFSVVSLDAPGHGRSSGRRASMPAMAAAMRAVAASAPPLAGLLAHSIGAGAAALAMRDGLQAGRVVFLAPAADPDAFTARFAAHLGLGPAVLRGMKARAERRLGLRWSDLHVPSLVTRMTAPLLVVHDRADREVSWEDGTAIAAAWPEAELVTTEGLGHARILSDPGVVTRAVAFLAGSSGPSGAKREERVHVRT